MTDDELVNLITQHAAEAISRSKQRAWQAVVRAARQAANLDPIRGRKATYDRTEIARRLAAGETQSQIAQALGCTQALISIVKRSTPALS